MSNSNTKNYSTFASGFSLGMFLGAAGYFMFKTDDGNKLKMKLEGEWDVARVYLAKSGLIPDANMSLKDLGDFLLEQGEKSVAMQINSVSKPKPSKKTTKKTVKKTAPKKKTTTPAKKKFKGV